MPSPGPSLLHMIRHSNIVRIMMLFLLVLLFQIPIFALEGLVSERQGRRDAAVTEVASKWGLQQSIAGPLLIVPYRTHVEETSSTGKTTVREEQHLATFLPERLTTRGAFNAESRRRGIFSTSVYRTLLHVEGSFVRPSFSAWGIDAKDIQWERAQLVMGISDIRAIESTASLRWNGKPAEVLPGTNEGAVVKSGVHADVTVPDDTPTIPFSMDLPLKGSAGVYWTPLGKTTSVSATSNWPSPSFQGNWLPEKRSVGPKGFEADWNIAYLGRNFPQAWRDGAVSKEALDAARFGIDLIEANDQYQMARRSVKYAGLFLMLTFATLWLVEVLAGVSVHPIQYLLVGCAMCVFYLLELSLSEHLGFGAAYLIATLAIVAQVAGYCSSVLRTWGRAGIVGGMTAALYGYLFVVLTNEDYALLIGSLGVFAALAAIMFLTRRVNWWGEQPVREAA